MLEIQHEKYLMLSGKKRNSWGVFSWRFSTKRARLLQWLVFFRQTTELLSVFGTEVNQFRGNPAVTGSSPCYSQKLFRAIHLQNRTRLKGLPFQFFGFVRLFPRPPSFF